MRKLCVLFLFVYSVSSAAAQNEYVVNTSIESPIQNTIIDFLKTSKEHTILIDLLEVTEMYKVLTEVGPYTLFAPTDTAFKKLPKRLISELMLPENKDRLRAILSYHILNESINTSEISRTIHEYNDDAIYKTLNGSMLVVYKQNEFLIVEDAKGNNSFIKSPDNKQNNGYVHIVDTVILPN